MKWTLAVSRQHVRIEGLPYFPGVATGQLHKGSDGDLSGRILLVSQEDASDFIELPAGLIVTDSVPFSHKMIALLGLGLPTVLISADQASLLEARMLLTIDGESGLINSQPCAMPELTAVEHTPEPECAVHMLDAEPVNLNVSVREPSAVTKARALGAAAVGLVRSEFFLPEHNRVPDVAFYKHVFGEICVAASPLTVTIRLLDLAADKLPTWLTKITSAQETQGLQGIRFYSLKAVRQIVEAQLAAVSSLASVYSIRVLLPFLVRIEEYDYWRAWCQEYLPDDMAIGAMAETPAMVLDSSRLISHADFVAIGCNDLMQYVFAADRDQPALRYYLDPYAPVLFRLLRLVAEQTGTAVKDIQLCGVLPQIHGVLPVLLGLGYRTFSIEPVFIPYLTQIINKRTIPECKTLADRICAAENTSQVLEILEIKSQRHPPFCL